MLYEEEVLSRGIDRIRREGLDPESGIVFFVLLRREDEGELVFVALVPDFLD